MSEELSRLEPVVGWHIARLFAWFMGKTAMIEYYHSSKLKIKKRIIFLPKA